MGGVSADEQNSNKICVNGLKKYIYSIVSIFGMMFTSLL